jgi:hypothetical protein
MCLKPTLLLWLAALFLSKAITLPIVIGIGHIAGVNTDAMTLLRDFWSEDQLVPAVFAFPVLYACGRRVPMASDAVRWIWSRGRTLLSLAAIIDIALTATSQFWHRETDQTIVGAALSTGADLYFLAYILAARRVRDTFERFPPRLDFDKKR